MEYVPQLGLGLCNVGSASDLHGVLQDYCGCIVVHRLAIQYHVSTQKLFRTEFISEMILRDLQSTDNNLILEHWHLIYLPMTFTRDTGHYRRRNIQNAIRNVSTLILCFYPPRRSRCNQSTKSCCRISKSSEEALTVNTHHIVEVLPA